MASHYNIFQETCGCFGRPIEKIRLFSLVAESEQDAVVQSMNRVPPGTKLVAEFIAAV